MASASHWCFDRLSPAGEIRPSLVMDTCNLVGMVSTSGGAQPVQVSTPIGEATNEPSLQPERFR